jgi:hypothetical protein
VELALRRCGRGGWQVTGRMKGEETEEGVRKEEAE